MMLDEEQRNAALRVARVRDVVRHALIRACSEDQAIEPEEVIVGLVQVIAVLMEDLLDQPTRKALIPKVAQYLATMLEKRDVVQH
jgi:homoserine kinase